jgi:heterodisulfide reductase subunit A-like polyferredoxin
MYSAKQAVLTRKFSQNIKSYIFRHKIRAFGKNFYEFAKKAQEEYDIKYFKSKVYNITETSKNNDLIINYKDLEAGKKKKFIANMVVLASPLVYSVGTKKLAKILGVQIDKFGFYKEKSYLEKTLSTRDGIYLSGYCQSPMDISETVANASAVASSVANFLSSVKFTQIPRRKLDISPKEDLIKIEPKALIIGGGIAGMTAALNIANQGYKSYIVEKSESLGGNLQHINLLYPNKKNPQEILDEIKEKIKGEENIKIFLNSTIETITGSIGNYKVFLKNSKAENHSLYVGTIIIATGGQELKPKGLYLYGNGNKNILTQMELEKRLKNQSIDWINNIHHITMILCAGAREKGAISYCSNVCCTNAIKNINILEDIKPDLQLLVYYRDLHMAKKEFEDYFSEKNKTAKFMRFSPENPPKIVKISNNPERYRIKIKDEYNLQHMIEFGTDLIILSTPIIPPDDLDSLAKLLEIPLDEYGFFTEAHIKLRPLDFSKHGIFLCGCAKWPKNVQDSISEAKGASARASRFLSLERISPEKLKLLSFLISIECHFKDMLVDAEKCNGCGRCVENCQFKAITLVEKNREFEDIIMQIKKARINPAICKGCGKCASICRLKAITARHYDFDQISAIMDPFFLETEGTQEFNNLKEKDNVFRIIQ